MRIPPILDLVEQPWGMESRVGSSCALERGEKTVTAVGTPAITDLNGILHVVFLERSEGPKVQGKPIKWVGHTSSYAIR